MRFIVRVRETWSRAVEVDAEDASDAILRVLDGEGEELDPPELEETQDAERWSASGPLD